MKKSVEEATLVEDTDEEDGPLPPRSVTSKKSNKSISSKQSGNRNTAAQKRQLRAKKDLSLLTDDEDEDVSLDVCSI
jgi:hypothetical protein